MRRNGTTAVVGKGRRASRGKFPVSNAQGFDRIVSPAGPPWRRQNGVEGGRVAHRITALARYDWSSMRTAFVGAPPHNRLDSSIYPSE